MHTQPHSADRDLLIITADDTINDDSAEMEVLRLESEIVKGDATRFILDCSRIEFLSSYGLGIILRLRNAASMVSREIVLVGVDPLLQKMFDATRVAHLFKIFPDIEKARQVFTISS